MPVTGIPNEFKTPAIAVDVPVIKGFRDKDWVGVGLTMYSDNSGSLDLKHSAFKLSAAYHFALDKKGNSIISLGYQTGSVQRKIDVSGLSSDPQEKNPDLLEPDQQLTGELKNSYTDHVGGLHFKTTMDEGDVLQFGFSAGHFGKPQGSLGVPGGGGGAGVEMYEIPMRILGHASYRTMMNDRLAMTPSVFFQTLGNDKEIQVQSVGEYLFNAEKQVVLKAGLGYRFGDALQVILGTDIRDLKVTFGYDVNISRLAPASNTVGGIELSVQLVGIIYKKPDPDPVLFCPRF
jgi:type IX secretion system PorP/SprF family membrane protein